jgi:hypothetical protein
MAAKLGPNVPHRATCVRRKASESHCRASYCSAGQPLLVQGHRIYAAELGPNVLFCTPNKTAHIQLVSLFGTN